MQADLSSWQQIAVHFGALCYVIRLGKLRPAHLARSFGGIFRAVAGL